MTDKKYSGLGSRFVLGTLKSTSGSDDEDIFLSDSIPDRPELRVQLRYFTVELKPSRRTVKNNRIENTCKSSTDTGSKTISVNGQKKTESGKSVSSPETNSCDSFHSCRSSTSIQELPCPSEDVDVSSNRQIRNIVGETKRTTIRDTDLLNNLTMVNAIFLSKRVSDSIDHESSNKNHLENAKSSGKLDSLDTLSTPASSNKVCSETYTCQINNNPRVKYINKIYGNNIVTKPEVNSFHTLYDKIRGDRLSDRLSYTKTFSESFEPVLNIKKGGFEIVEKFNTYDSNGIRTELDGTKPSNWDFKRTLCSSSPFSTYTKLVIKVPEMKFAELLPLCDESSLPVVLDQINIKSISQTDQKRRRSVLGCEENLKFSTPKNSLSLISVESEDNSDVPDNVHGDGDFAGYAYTENSGRQSNKLFLESIDDTYIKMLISKSLKKIRNDSARNLRLPESDESDIFESDEENTSFNEYKEDALEKTTSGSAEPSLQFKKLRLKSCFQESGRDKYRTDVNAEHEDDHRLSLVDEYDSDNNHSEHSSDLISRASLELVPNQPEVGYCKRGMGERTRALSVIQEESSEESIEDTRDLKEDSLADDYCLIYSNGRPIHLFDKQGLPLTDNSGRPLRSAQGHLLMNCDQNGIPVVDHDCGIFDMFGRQPHEDRFDPSMAPKMSACSKLSAGDGRPLLLFDAQGRPLTSVSGTTLVDSSGRGLVRLNTAAVTFNNDVSGRIQ